MKKKNFIKDVLEVAIGVAIISFVLLKFIILPCEVRQSSMLPTLKENDRGYSFIITRNIDIKRFDICVIDQKDSDSHLLVKRIIGLPNETLEYKDNKLYINGEYIEEPFLQDSKTENTKIELKDNEYYCLGDNRSVSKDSRYYGAFTKDEIVSTKMFIIYPFEDFGVKK